MPLDDALAILMESVYRRTGTSVANLAAINAEVRALARGHAANRLRQLFSVRNADRKRWSDTDWKTELAAMIDKEASDGR